MQAEDRIIHFACELIHQPITPKKDVLQKLYFDLAQTRHGAYDSTDFTNPAQTRFYTRKSKKTQSIALFLPDRAVLVEEWTDLALTDFVERVREVGSRLLPARNQAQLIAHTATIRSTFALSHFDDARQFILDHACGQQGRIGPHFQRPIATGGLRFTLPETNEHPGNYQVSIESFRLSNKEVFVEVKGIFSRERLTVDQLNTVLDNIRAVRAFISDRVYPYLEQFDQPRDTVD